MDPYFSFSKVGSYAITTTTTTTTTTMTCCCGFLPDVCNTVWSVQCMLQSNWCSLSSFAVERAAVLQPHMTAPISDLEHLHQQHSDISEKCLKFLRPIFWYVAHTSVSCDSLWQLQYRAYLCCVGFYAFLCLFLLCLYSLYRYINDA